MKLRGILTIALSGTVLVVADVVQRTIIVPAVALVPSRRERILARWQQGLARGLLGIARFIGGARFGDVPRIDGGEGTLILMNHQSLMDIPLVVRTVRPAYPRIVTRERYARGKPVISHMVRLYQYPTVDPGATVRGTLVGLQEQTASSPVPVVIFPEGTRTRDGELGRFRKMGLRAILGGRSWETWIVVVDGWWRSARLTDFIANVSTVEGRIRVVGPFRSPEHGEPVGPFIAEMERRMAEAYEQLRAGDEAALPVSGAEG